MGRSGQLLDQMLEQVGLSRNRNVFITNIVKCRPPENRDPMPEECLACRPWLDKILELIDPKIILCVGRIAAQQQLFDPNFRVTRQHGEIRERDGRLVMATFHPAALLRNPSYKPMMEEDLRRLAEDHRRGTKRTDSLIHWKRMCIFCKITGRIFGLTCRAVRDVV